MERLKEKKVNTKEKLQEETMKKLIKLTEEEQQEEQNIRRIIKETTKENADVLIKGSLILKNLSTIEDITEDILYMLDSVNSITNENAKNIENMQGKILNSMLDLQEKIEKIVEDTQDEYITININDAK